MRANKEYRLKLTEEAKKIVSGMSLEEKVNLMSANMDISILTPEYVGRMMTDDKMHYNVTPYEAGGCERVGLPPMKFADGPRGVVCGNGQSSNYTGGVGGDRRESLGLHRDEVELLQAVLPVNPNHAAVLIGGNMIMMTEWEPLANAVLMAYYPGQEGGTAIAEILFGDVNPSGKLPYVVPYKESDLPYVDWNATDQYYEYYHGYARLDKNGVAPLVPYGFGLSYTAFEFTAPEVAQEGSELVARLSVKNTGARAGDEVVQLYAGCEQSAVDRPLRQLKGFARVRLEPGESRPVEIRVPLEKLKWYDPVRREWKLEHTEYTIYTGSSEALKDLQSAKILLGE